MACTTEKLPLSAVRDAVVVHIRQQYVDDMVRAGSVSLDPLKSFEHKFELSVIDTLPLKAAVLLQCRGNPR